MDQRPTVTYSIMPNPHSQLLKTLANIRGSCIAFDVETLCAEQAQAKAGVSQTQQQALRKATRI